MSADTATPAAWQETTEGLLLSVGSCSACGHRFYPPQQYGCERCGAAGDALTTVAVPAVGRLEALVGVVRPDFAVHVGEVRLAEADVVVRAPVADGAAVGDEVRGETDQTTPPVVFSTTTGASR